MCDLHDSIEKKDVMLIKWSPRVNALVERLEILENICLAHVNNYLEFDLLNTTYNYKFPYYLVDEESVVAQNK